MRRTIDEQGFVHGANGYRMGCGCGTCTEAHRERRARYEAEKLAGGAVTPRESVSLHSTADNALHSLRSPLTGNMEAKTVAALHAVGAEGAEAELLREQALTGARIVDDAVTSGRLHLVAAGNRILNESLDRLRTLAVRGGDQAGGVGSSGDDFLDKYMKF